MSSRDDKELALKRQRELQYALAKKQQTQKIAEQEAENRNRAVSGFVPGSPLLETSPVKPPFVNDQQFAKEQKETFEKLLKFIDGSGLSHTEKEKLKAGCSFDSNSGSIKFSSVQSAAQFMNMNRDAALGAQAGSREDAIRLLKDCKEHGILGSLKKLEYVENGEKRLFEGGSLDKLKKDIFKRPTPY